MNIAELAEGIVFITIAVALSVGYVALLIANQGGTLECEAESDQGGRFKLRLPRTGPASLAPASPERDSVEPD